MSRTFRFLYWRVCCVMCTTRKKVMGHHHLHHAHHHHHHHRRQHQNAKVRRRCRTSIRAPGMKVGPRHSLKFRLLELLLIMILFLMLLMMMIMNIGKNVDCVGSVRMTMFRDLNQRDSNSLGERSPRIARR